MLENFNEFTQKYDKFFSELQQCKSFTSHLLTKIISMERNNVTNSQYSGRKAIKMNPVPADIHEDLLEEKCLQNIISLTGVNVVPNDLPACHLMKRF